MSCGRVPIMCRVARWLFLVALSPAASPPSQNSVRGQEPPTKASPSPDSPRLATLTRQIKARGRDALEQFWKDMNGNVPLVEAIPGNDRLRLITFLWRGGDDTAGIKLIGPLPPGIGQKQLTRLAGTDVWYLTERFPTATRFSYAFAHSGMHYPDPLNPLSIKTGTAPPEGRDSMVEMPDAPKQVWVGARKDVPKGTLKPHRVRSETLNEERTVSVYTPASYDPKGTPCALLLVVDGEDYRQLVPTPTILDNLIAERKLPPVVAVLIDNADKASRLRDLACSAPFADFLARELVPWARASYRLSADPKQTVICGSSLGGLCAAYCGFRCPDVFGNVLSQSGSFWYYPGWPKEAANVADLGWLTRQFEEAQALPIRFYLEAGLFEVEEPLNILAGNQRLHKVLAGKGYSVKYSEFAGGHEHLSWRGSLADGLIHLIGTEE